MNRAIVLSAVLLCLLVVLAPRLHSGPKTINVGENPLPGVASPAGIPAEFGDLVAVDAGYLYFVDGDGTIRRLALGNDGAILAVLTVPRK